MIVVSQQDTCDSSPCSLTSGSLFFRPFSPELFAQEILPARTCVLPAFLFASFASGASPARMKPCPRRRRRLARTFFPPLSSELSYREAWHQFAHRCWHRIRKSEP